MFAPAAPPSPSRRNLDYAFPPFALGLPSVYERAGFDVNPSATRSRSGSRSSSIRKGSFSGSSAAASSASLRSQTSFGAALPPQREASPVTPASQYSQFEAELQKPLAPAADPRRPSSPLVNAAVLPKKPLTEPRPDAAANPYATTPSAPSITVAGPESRSPEHSIPSEEPAPGPGPTHYAPPPSVSPYNPYRGDEAGSYAHQNTPGPLSVDTSGAEYNGKSQTSSPDQQTHSQSASNASTATSDFEFLDTKPELHTMPLNVKPAWAQAQDRAHAHMPQPMPQPMSQPTPQGFETMPAEEAQQKIYMPQPLYRTGGADGNNGPAGGLLGVPQHDLNRMSTTSSIYSNRVSVMPQPPQHQHQHQHQPQPQPQPQPRQREMQPREADSLNSDLANSSSLYDESESSVSFDFADSHRPFSVPHAEAETSLQSQISGDSQSSGKKRKYCRGCLNPIVGKSVRSRDGTLSGRWHRECFMCTRCETPLTGSSSDIHVHEDQPFCPGCYHVVAHTTCRMCGKGIEGSCLEATAEASGSAPLLYHVNCLRCAECQIHLQQSYFEVDGATYCAEHAFTSLPQNTEVHKRFTQFMMI